VKSSVRACAIQRPPARCHQRSEPCIVVKPKDQQVKMTASHQRRETDRGAGEAGQPPALLGVARLGGAGFFLALSFRIPPAFYPDRSPAERLATRHAASQEPRSAQGCSPITPGTASSLPATVMSCFSKDE